MAPLARPPWLGSEKLRTLTTQTRMQMTVITLARRFPKSSTFCLRGVFSLIWDEMDVWMSPMAVEDPVAVTMARAEPLTMVVPCRRTFRRQFSSREIRRGKEECSYREEHVDHVLLDGVLILDSGGSLADTLTLSRQERLIDGETRGEDGNNAGIGGLC